MKFFFSLNAKLFFINTIYICALLVGNLALLCEMAHVHVQPSNLSL